MDNLIACMTDEALLNWFADTYGQTVFCERTPESDNLRKDCEKLKAEILRRMKKPLTINPINVE